MSASCSDTPFFGRANLCAKSSSSRPTSKRTEAFASRLKLPRAVLVLGVALLLGPSCAAKRKGRPPAASTAAAELSAERPTSDQQGADGPAKKSVVLQVPRIPSHFNPLLDDLEVWGLRLSWGAVFEPLFRCTGAGPQGHLVAEHRWTGDWRQILILKLQPGVVFHDGRPVTSADLRYTLLQLKRQKNHAGWSQRLFQLLHVGTLDDLTVELRFLRHDETIIRDLCDATLLSVHANRRLGLRATARQRRPIGTGPYRLVLAQNGKGLSLVRYTEYWREPALLERIEVTAIADPSRALAALRNGRVDILGSLYHGYFPEQLDGERFRQRFHWFRVVPRHFRVLWFNTARYPFNQRTVRAALIHGIDRRAILKLANNDLGQIPSGPILPRQRSYDHSLHPRRYDQRAALRLLGAAGWSRRGRGGALQRLGHRFVARLVHADAALPTLVARRISADLEALGIRVDRRSAAPAFLARVLRKGDFDLAVAGIALGHGTWLSSFIHSRAPLNYGGYSNKALDTLLDFQRAGRGDPDPLRVEREVHRMLYANPAFSVLYAPAEVIVARREVEGLALGGGAWPALWRLKRVSAVGLGEAKPEAKDSQGRPEGKSEGKGGEGKE